MTFFPSSFDLKHYQEIQETFAERGYARKLDANYLEFLLDKLEEREMLLKRVFALHRREVVSLPKGLLKEIGQECYGRGWDGEDSPKYMSVHRLNGVEACYDGPFDTASPLLKTPPASMQVAGGTFFIIHRPSPHSPTVKLFRWHPGEKKWVSLTR